MSIPFETPSPRLLGTSLRAERHLALAVPPVPGPIARLARWLKVRRAEQQLLRLGEAGLKDIGIGSGGAEWAARNGRKEASGGR